MARSECPDSNGAINGSRAARSVDRSTSMYARTGAGEADQAACSARPRPFSARCSTVTPGSSSVRDWATAMVASVLALSATVIRNGYGRFAVRYPCRRRTQGPRSTCSLWTGITTSRTGPVREALTVTGRPVRYAVVGGMAVGGSVDVLMPTTMDGGTVVTLCRLCGLAMNRHRQQDGE